MNTFDAVLASLAAADHVLASELAVADATPRGETEVQRMKRKESARTLRTEQRFLRDLHQRQLKVPEEALAATIAAALKDSESAQLTYAPTAPTNLEHARFAAGHRRVAQVLTDITNQLAAA